MQSILANEGFIDKTGCRIVLMRAATFAVEAEVALPVQVGRSLSTPDGPAEGPGEQPVNIPGPSVGKPTSCFNLSPIRTEADQKLRRPRDWRPAVVMGCVVLGAMAISADRIRSDDAVAKALVPRTDISTGISEAVAQHGAEGPAAVPVVEASPAPPVAPASLAEPQKTEENAASADPDPAAQDARLAELFARRGDTLLAQRKVVEARKFYSLAARAGSARGARTLARSYDPVILARYHVTEVQPDPALAEFWARRASSLGEPTTLAQLEAPAARALVRPSPVRPHPAPAPSVDTGGDTEQ